MDLYGQAIPVQGAPVPTFNERIKESFYDKMERVDINSVEIIAITLFLVITGIMCLIVIPFMILAIPFIGTQWIRDNIRDFKAWLDGHDEH